VLKKGMVISMAIKNETLNVGGMSCSHCENAVKKAVGALDGVNSVEVSLGNKIVAVNYDDSKVDLNAIKEAIDEQGYEVE
jgi:copper chaperone